MFFSKNGCGNTVLSNLLIFHITGYQIGRPLIAGVVQALDNNTGAIQRTSVDLWKPGNISHLLPDYY